MIWEISNALLSVERQKRATAADVKRHLDLLKSLPIEVDENSVSQVWHSTLIFAQKHRLTTYDASYLELASRRGLPLASLDGALVAAGKAEKMKLI